MYLTNGHGRPSESNVEHLRQTLKKQHLLVCLGAKNFPVEARRRLTLAAGEQEPNAPLPLVPSSAPSPSPSPYWVRVRVRYWGTTRDVDPPP